MNLKDNLKKIRKDNNLSQEDLAEKLGVSRQAVSKWESGTAYPEMDKVLQICNLFNLNIDDLLNQDIKEIEKKNSLKVNTSKYIDDFLNFITKTVRMFGSMKFKDKCKCLLEELILIGILSLLFALIGDILHNIFDNIIYLLPDKVNFIVANIFETIYYSISVVLGTIILINVFKTRYLNYYVIIDSESCNEEVIDNENDTKENQKQEKYVLLENKKEKVIIRDPKHSEYKFLNAILKCMLFFFKAFVLFIAMLFCASFVLLIVLFILSFLVLKTKLLFGGLLLVLISCLIINFIILNVLYNFIINRKSKKVLIGILLIAALSIFGIGSGFTIISFKDFEMTDNYEKYLKTKTQNIEMNDNLIIDIYNLKYIESDNNDLKFVIKSLNDNDIIESYYILDDYEKRYLHYPSYSDIFSAFNLTIKTINNKEILEDYNYCEVELYTNKDNIEKIKENSKKFFD